MATPYRTLEWIGGPTGHLRLLDQTKLPNEIVYRDCHTADGVWHAIKTLCVRGAPAIGVAAAYGAVLGVRQAKCSTRIDVRRVTDHLRTSRPTAVNLFWALDRMDRVAAIPVASSATLVQTLLAEARAIEAEDHATCRRIGEIGAPLIPEGGGVLTHCNAGALATAGLGTALAALYVAWDQGKRFRVFADETRPLLQGARLTAWELLQHGIPTTVICDNMAAQVMREGKVQLVIVGADRIAANGDVANKIGTYGLALLAQMHDIPFYVAAPLSTFDVTLPEGANIPIEQRSAEEVSRSHGCLTAPEGVDIYNPSFDTTPSRFITGIITEYDIIQPVNSEHVHRTLGVAREKP
jgi:methylthioribose-1-phosphate isomerase